MRCLAATLFLCLGLLTSAQPAWQSKVDRRPRICVVAVRDSSLFTLCPGEGSRPAISTSATRQRVVVSGPGFTGSVSVPLHTFPMGRVLLDRSRPDWEELARSTPGLCRSGFVDVSLKALIEKEFRKIGTYSVVPSPEDAQQVFLIESNYITGMSYAAGPDNVPAASGAFHRLESAVAVVVPAGLYREKPAESEALLRGAVWRGVSIPVRIPGQGLQPEPEQLVRDYAEKRKPGVQTPPACEAWSMPPNPRAAQGARPSGLAGTPAAAPPPFQSEGVPVAGSAIRVNVVMVTVPVVVTDGRGEFLPGLTERDFRVFEDGREQKIATLIPETGAFHVALAVDTSNSTRLRHVDIQMAASEFADALRAQDRLMLLSFGEYVAVDSEFSTNRESMLRAIMNTRVSGGTRLYDAVDLVIRDRLNQISGRKAVVLFSDGVDTQSRLATFESSLATAEESGSIMYAVQFDTRPAALRRPDEEAPSAITPPGSGKADYDLGSKYLQNLTNQSGGRVYPAGNLAGIRAAFAQIAGELRHQYTICYYPERPGDDGSFHRIQVAVDRPDVRVRARNGYRK